MTKQINVGGVAIGGGAPVSIQSMTNTPTEDAARTAAQIKQLQDAGCEIVGTYDPYAMGLDYTSFYDGYHPTDFVVAKVLEQLWEE